MTEHPTSYGYGTSIFNGHRADRRRPDSLLTRQALVRLRLAEFVAADYLPPDLMQELTSAIDGVIDIVRGDHP